MPDFRFLKMSAAAEAAAERIAKGSMQTQVMQAAEPKKGLLSKLGGPLNVGMMGLMAYPIVGSMFSGSPEAPKPQGIELPPAYLDPVSKQMMYEDALTRRAMAMGGMGGLN